MTSNFGYNRKGKHGFFLKKSKKTNGAYELTYELSGRESKA
jgi:hypothetical protein